MFSLPIIFLCNALLFVMILEERFKTVTTLLITAAALVLSFISRGVISGIFTDPAAISSTAQIVSVLWFLLASVIASPNNIAHKLFVAIALITNYRFIPDFGAVVLSKLPGSGAGMMGMLLGNGLYILCSLIVMALLTRPFHYFYRRPVSPTDVGVCILMAFACSSAAGGANEFFEADSFALRFFVTLLLYIMAVFVIRSAYSGARYKAKDIFKSSENEILNIRADSINSMVINVESFRQARDDVSFAFEKIQTLADEKRTDEISAYAAEAISAGESAVLLDHYCDDPYINAVVATKTADAADKGIELDCSIALGDMNIRLIEVCILVNDLLSWAIKNSEKSEGEKFVRLNVLPAKDQLTLELVHSIKPEDKEKFTARTLGSYVKTFFRPEPDADELRSVKDIVEKHSGRMNISETRGTSITRLGIYY